MSNGSLDVPKVRETIVDGIFYPQDPKELKKKLEELFSQTTLPRGKSFGIIVPHAGLLYAGRLIAEAYNAAADRRVKTVIILAPEHRDGEEEIILPESAYFKTPLGRITVDQNTIEELLCCGTNLIRNDLPHLEEHCIEIQLPFIQHLYPQALIIPILFGKPKPSLVKMLYNAIQITFKNQLDEILIVATSNLTSQYYPEQGDHFIDLFIKSVQLDRWEVFLEKMLEYKINACGAACIATLLNFKDKNVKIELLGRGSSLETNPNSQNPVFYSALSANF